MIDMIPEAGRSDIGQKREYNEDCICEVPEASFYAVADGMGQLVFGKETAETICDFMKENALLVYEDFLKDKDETKAAQALKGMVEEISNNFYRRGNSPDVYRYGCTFCCVMIFSETMAIVHIGDSRAYAVSRADGKMRQVTEDENLAGYVVKNGYMTYEEAVKRGFASRLQNFIGVSEETEAKLYILERKDVSGILLCSDGLSGMVEDEVIEQKFTSSSDPAAVCDDLVKAANENGGKDNISVVCIRL